MSFDQLLFELSIAYAINSIVCVDHSDEICF